eukprot:TRINITY_DN17402_c0_g1_i1.p1 TRINITY_DN17402_c0_g1~~TRINITY_DN17402_c0_g1_i1.p1  ORF type:complete len:171 (+),score=24.81 TRINITY_DN17402_c0_g1_i1:30-542(+)
MSALCEVSSLFKVLESFGVFVAVVLHRIGNQGSQVWFGTTDFEMNYKNTPNETDAEIIGSGILACMGIVTPSILLSYLIEGRDRVQVTVLDCAFNFIAGALLMTAGGMCCYTYNSVFALSGPPTIANLNISRNSQQVAAAMGVMCLSMSLVYIADFFWCLVQRARWLTEV